MQLLRKELEKHGCTVENHHHFVGTAEARKPGWKTRIFEDVGKKCESRFCLIHVCTAGQGIGMEITFRDFFGAMDLFNALTGNRRR